MRDVTDLITEDHARILRLFAALDGLIRNPHPRAGPTAVGGTWDRLAGLLELHVQAEQEICYPALLPAIAHDGLLFGLTADCDDILEALAEARLCQPATTVWWQVVIDARGAAHHHIRAGTQHLMPLLAQAGPQRRGTLGQQWAACTAAWLRDSAGRQDLARTPETLAARPSGQPSPPGRRITGRPQVLAPAIPGQQRAAAGQPAGQPAVADLVADHRTRPPGRSSTYSLASSTQTQADGAPARGPVQCTGGQGSTPVPRLESGHGQADGGSGQ